MSGDLPPDAWPEAMPLPPSSDRWPAATWRRMALGTYQVARSLDGQLAETIGQLEELTEAVEEARREPTRAATKARVDAAAERAREAIMRSSTIAKTARDYHVHVSTVSRWRAKAKKS